ncbi:hypothetical protein HYS31_01065 [Candidatus Woesearchaeota archaeon]|nr:hypothetical protein [Candidatus Woesearchaeota archaeon]
MGVLSISTKAQAWYMDFAIAMLLFLFTLAFYFNYTNNIQNEEQSALSTSLKDAKSISSSLALGGYPQNWDNTSVIRIGIADDTRVNSTKLQNFKKMSYKSSKKLFGTIFEYFVFFLNDKGEVININGICGIGSSLVNATYNIKSAYYYQDEDDSFLKGFMESTFKADIYLQDIAGLTNNISKYSFIVMEHPLLSGSEFSNNKANLENFSSRGGIFMISGELATPATNNMAGANFKKKSGQSSSQRTAIVNNSDQYLSFTVGQSMVFDQYYYAENASGSSNFKIIATFNQTSDNAIARWNYGNGTLFFFSDFDVSYFSDDFVGIVEEAAKSLVGGTCNPINISGISIKNLAKAERYMAYNSKLVKMVVYSWQ